MKKIMTTKGYRYLWSLRVKIISQSRAADPNDWEFVVLYRQWWIGDYVRVDRLTATNGMVNTTHGPMPAKDLRLWVEHGEMPCGLVITYQFVDRNGEVVQQSIRNEVDGTKVKQVKGDAGNFFN